MVDQTEYERWIVTAEQALETARTSAGAASHNWACFLAEQAAQLALKGLLHGIGAGAWGHDLVELGNGVRDSLEEDLPERVVDVLAGLSQYYIPTRYPDAQPSGDPGLHYTSAHSTRAIADVEHVLGYIRGKWSELEAAAGEEA